MSHRRVDGRGRYSNEAIALKGDEAIRREGLQARGIYKEVPRPSRRLGLATRQKIPYRKGFFKSFSKTIEKDKKGRCFRDSTANVTYIKKIERKYKDK